MNEESTVYTEIEQKLAKLEKNRIELLFLAHMILFQ